MTPLWRGLLATPSLRRTPLPAVAAAATAATAAAGGMRQRRLVAPGAAAAPAPAAAARSPPPPRASAAATAVAAAAARSPPPPRAHWRHPPRSGNAPGLGGGGGSGAGGGGGVLAAAAAWPRAAPGRGAFAAAAMSAGADAAASSPSGTIAVWVTVPSAEVGEALASKVVEARLAACVNILPGVTSVYRWEGKVNKDPELLLIIKTRAELLTQLTAFVRANHPYDEPEVVALPILGGSASYLQWLKDSTAPDAAGEAAAAGAAAQGS